MQQHGQIVAVGIELDDDTSRVVPGTGKVGVVKSVGSARLAQPDRVTRDATTNEEIDREARPDLDVSSVTVAWEDGSESTLVEHLDDWTVLGSVLSLPTISDAASPPPGAFAELPEQKAEVDAVVARIGEYAQQLRDAAPFAEARAAAERTTTVEDDGTLTLVE